MFAQISPKIKLPNISSHFNLFKNLNITMKIYDIKHNPQLNNKFIPNKIQNQIQNIDKLKKVIINVNNINIIIKYVPTFDIIPMIKSAIFLSQFQYLGDFKIQNKFNITLYPIFDKKYFPNNNDFDIDHINSGQTTKWLNKSSNIIFRKEEMQKVLIHEMLHSIEVRNNWTSNLTINGSININEAYIEATSVIIWCQLNKKNIGEQILFSIFQSAKILFIAKITLDELLQSHTKIINQQTSVIEYHILKSALIFDPNYFINNIMFKMCDKDFIKKLENIIINNLNDLQYRKIFNHYTDLLYTIQDTELFRTARMTY